MERGSPGGSDTGLLDRVTTQLWSPWVLRPPASPLTLLNLILSFVEYKIIESTRMSCF